MRNGMWYPSRLWVRERGCSTRKGCACGGHNSSNPKKNCHHHSTRARLDIRAERRFVRALKGAA